MKFLIFGGTGFVGRNLIPYIKEKGGEVFSVSRSGGGGSLAVDISKEEDFSKINFQPDVIINCASRIPEKGKKSTDPDFLRELFQTNVVGAVNITNWAVKNHVPFIINCSTLVVVKKPWPSPLKEDYLELPDGFHVGYAMSKLSQEQIMDQAVHGSETGLVHARLSAVYGEGMTPEGIIFRLLKKFLQNEEVILSDAEKNSLDLIHVKDVCRAIYALSRTKPEDSVINLARGKAVSILDLAKTLKQITGSHSVIRDEVTDNPSSLSNVEVKRLKNYIGDEYKNFMDLNQGLTGLTENFRARLR